MLRKYNLEIMTAIFFGVMTFCSVFVKDLSLIQRIMLGCMFLYTLHEWEESRFPGGFMDLMAKFFGVRISSEQAAASHIPVAVFLLVIMLVPFFTQLPILALVPVYLGLFEMFIHIAGIRIHRMKKPYTPGMITGIILGIVSAAVLITFSKERLLSGSGYAWGALITILCFVAMQRTVLAIYGLSYKSVMTNVKNK